MKTPNHAKTFVKYLRVSTQKQGLNGNGIHAQQRDIQIFLQSQKNPEVIGEFVEVESGANNARPQLDAALTLCRRTGSHLIVSNTSRWSRDVEFVAGLLKDKQLTIRVANLPNASHFQIHLFSAISMQEREFVILRTKSAMAAAKARGPKVGNPGLAEMNKERNRERRREARNFADGVAPIAMPLREKGMSFQEIADTLNQMKLKTARGSSYHPMQVKRVIDRCKEGSVL